MNKWLKNNLPSPPCLLCGLAPEHDAIPGDLCRHCYATLPRNLDCCACCALPLRSSTELDPQHKPPMQPAICGHCLNQPPAFSQSYIPFHYTPPLISLITELKFNHKLHHARTLGKLLVEFLREQRDKQAIPAPECIIPVPLHPQRLRQRGYNQALELARPIARELTIKIESRLCLRQRNTAPQSELNLKERKKNLHQAFALVDSINYQHVAIVDDVVTSAQTVQELALVLKKAGVAQIEVWAIARA